MPATTFRHTPLRNRYFALRHGESEANIQQRIVSSAVNGVLNCGLTARGRQQVVDALNSTAIEPPPGVIVFSDFRRTRETAELVRDHWGCSRFEAAPALRERYFGDHELGSTEAYPTVWLQDQQNPHHKIAGVESVDEVVRRTTALINSLELRYCDEQILLVSHGDVLQMLQTVFNGLPPAEHRSVPHLQTGEFRELLLMV